MKIWIIAAGLCAAALVAFVITPGTSPQVKDGIIANISPGDLTRTILGLTEAEAAEAH